jgi:deazaflavin-dependent oxidoreductase (nitroreductase family)
MAQDNLFDRLRFLRRVAAPVEAATVRRFGRSPLSVAFRVPVLVLETSGRRTGARRATTLAYQPEPDGSLLIVGGAGGQTRNPDWVANLRADPRATITVDRCPRAVTMIELTGDEHAAAWERVRAEQPRVVGYERRAGHEIPIFRVPPPR